MCKETTIHEDNLIAHVSVEFMLVMARGVHWQKS